MNNWKFEIIDEIPDDVMAQHVFFHPELIKVWMETYRPLRRMTPINVKAICGHQILYMPLVLWQRNWKNAFENVVVPVGYSDYDYHDPIVTLIGVDVDYSNYWIELTQFLMNEVKCDALIIDGITDKVVSEEFFARGEICPRLSLNGIKNEDDLMSFFKTSLRGDLRRQMRRLSEIGELRYREYNSWNEIPASTFEEFMCQHANRWPHAYKAPGFHENLLKYGLDSGVVHFSTLKIGDKEIAWHLGFKYQGRYYYYMPAGNQEYFKYSPTKVHLFYLVRNALVQGFDIYDHLRGEENYKSGWSNHHEYVNTISIRNSAISSKMKEKLLSVKRLVSSFR